MKTLIALIVLSAFMMLSGCTTSGVKKDRSDRPVFHHTGLLENKG